MWESEYNVKQMKKTALAEHTGCRFSSVGGVLDTVGTARGVGVAAAMDKAGGADMVVGLVGVGLGTGVGWAISWGRQFWE